MKNFTYVFFLLLVSVQGFSQVQVGDGKLDFEIHAPIDPYYQYSYSQSIYLASEINASGLITSIEWYYDGPGVSLLTNSSPITIYLAQTTKSVFTSLTDYIGYNGLTEVYVGPISASAPGWVTLQLTTPFQYDGINNLAVAVVENNDGDSDYDDNFFNTEVGTNRTLARMDPWDPIEIIDPIPALYNLTYVPNIVFGGITEQCPVPIKLTASALTPTTATVTWNVPMTTTGGSEYYISTVDMDPDASTLPTGGITSGNSVNLEGLAPLTTHYIWVRNICGGVAGDWSYPGSFVTACVALTSFDENFDTTEVNSLPTCWSAILVNANPYATVTILSDPQYNSAPNAVQMQNSGSTPAADIILVTPELSNLPDRTNRLRFSAKAIDGANSLQVGTLNNNTANAVFTPFQTIATTTSYQEYFVDFTIYEGTDTYIGIRYNSPTGYTVQYIDDAVWELAPLCPDVSKVQIPVATPFTASVSWTAGASESQWEIVYAEASVTEPTGLTPLNSIPETTTAALTGLTENTSYNVWVRSSCGAGKGNWFGPVTFRTPCLPVNTFSENFDSTVDISLPDCWAGIVRGTPVNEWSRIETIEYMAHSEPRSVGLNLGANVADEVILVSPNLGNLPAQTNRLRFYARAAGSIEVGTLNSSTAPGIFTPFETVTTNAIGAQYVIDFTTYEGQDKFIGFRVHGSEYASIYLDDIIWEVKPGCPDVADVTVPEVTTSTATVIWSEGEASDWEVVTAEASVTSPVGLIPVAVSDATITVPGLNDGTIYKVWVRSVCELSKGNWSEAVLFTTVCLPTNDIDENFNSVETPYLPMCWTSIVKGANVDQTASVNSLTDIITETKTVQLWNGYSTGEYDVMLVSPELGNLSTGTYRLRFNARSNVANDIKIGTLNGNTEDADFNTLETVDVGLESNQYIIEFGSYTGEDRYIGIDLNSEIPGTTVFLDDIVWEFSPLCPDVTEINAQPTGATTTAITWSVGGGESNWQVVYGGTSVTDPTLLTAGPLLDESSVELTGLLASTSYKVWVRSVCEEDVTGNWVGPVTFTTECTPANIPYVQNFETTAVPSIPECSLLFNAGTGNNWTTVANPGFGLSTNTLRYSYNTSNAADAWYFTQGFNLTAQVPYYISYNYVNGSQIYNEKIKVMIGKNATVEAMTTTLEDNPEVNSELLHATEVVFTPTQTGVYYLGFNAYSEAGQYELYVDNIRVGLNLSTDDFDNSAFKFYPNPVIDVLNLSYTQNISNIAVYNLLGQKVMEEKTNSNSVQLDMSTLSAGSYFVKVSSDNKVKTLKIIKG